MALESFAVTGSVQEIFIADERGGTPYPVESVQAHAGRGLEGDRNFSPPDRWIGTGQAITLIESEVIADVYEQHGLDIREGRSRRQVVTAGIRLNDLVGREFTVGPLRCRGVELCEPCLDLQRMLDDPRTIKILLQRGGLRADILEGGELRPGAQVEAA
jgi:MOSC domain-containing protein YiiM